jgi:uncharacterized protein (DUF2147 family)
MTRLAPLALALAALALARPAAAADISGVWLTNTGDAQIRMARCGAAMCGTIVWLKEPKDPATGKPHVDAKNPDPAKRSHPLLGTVVAIGFRPSEDGGAKYVGSFYDADDGHTYRGSIAPAGDNELRVEGCLLMFCQTQTWTRVRR